MFPIRFKRPALLCMAMLTVVLSGCGLIQKVVDESKSVASAVFYKQIKILHLDFFSRSALNTHGLMRQIEETLLRYEPRLSQIQVELLPQPRPGHLNYLIHAQLPDTGWIRFDGVFSPEGRIVLRHLKQQERAY